MKLPKGERDRPLIFAASRQGNLLIIKGKPTLADQDGRYVLEDIPEGTYQIYGWIDNDNQEGVTAGDIFGMTPHTVTIGPDENIYNVDFEIEMYISPQDILLSE